jgi:protein TonB
MQRALPGSALVHAAIIGAAFIGFSWPEPDDAPAAESVSVSIVTMSSVSANATEVVQSDSTVDMVSSGAAETTPTTVEPIEPELVEPTTEPVEPLEPETQEPVTEPPLEPVPPEAQEQAAEQAVEPLPPDSVEPVEATTEVAVLSSTAINALASEPVAMAQPETIEPVSSEDAKVAPVPQTLSFDRPSTPTTRPQPQQQPRPRQATPPPPSTAGNGGANNADAVAAAGSAAQPVGSGSGGEAEVARYSSEVLRKLRRALRSNNGPNGEVLVRFTVLANGQVVDIGIGRSSGNSAVDQAGIATVGRAAPFPAIPPAANRSSWTFDVPLAFGG